MGIDVTIQLHDLAHIRRFVEIGPRVSSWRTPLRTAVKVFSRLPLAASMSAAMTAMLEESRPVIVAQGARGCEARFHCKIKTFPESPRHTMITFELHVRNVQGSKTEPLKGSSRALGDVARKYTKYLFIVGCFSVQSTVNERICNLVLIPNAGHPAQGEKRFRICGHRKSCGRDDNAIHAHLVAHTEHASVLQIHNDDCKIAEDPFEGSPQRSKSRSAIIPSGINGKSFGAMLRFCPARRLSRGHEQHDETIGEDKGCCSKRSSGVSWCRQNTKAALLRTKVFADPACMV
jgi:hypothetical protein